MLTKSLAFAAAEAFNEIFISGGQEMTFLGARKQCLGTGL